MVNRGPSGGCNTCKKRRVKCDEDKPRCQLCIRLGWDCGGYERRAPALKFKIVESAKFVAKPQRAQHLRIQEVARLLQSSSIPPPLAPAEQDVAVSFFLSHVVIMGRDFASTRGFFEIIPPFLAKEKSGSAVSLALAAVSTRMLNLFREGSSIKLPDKPFYQAVRRLQTAIQDPAESRSQGTILATLILQFWDNISAVCGLRPATRMHHDGAVALLKHQWPYTKDTSLYGKYLLGYILHVEVSSAIREKRSPSASILAWLKDDALHMNPSTRLDMIGMCVANLQNKFSQLVLEGSSIIASPQELVQLRTEAKVVTARLFNWLKDVPEHWQPVKLERVKACKPPLITYSGIIEIYPSIQVAGIWNVWRCYHLILLKISLAISPLGHRNSEAAAEFHGVDSRNKIRKRMQEIVDSICQSVPFFLGNRTGRMTRFDLTDSRIALPGYHDLDLSGNALPQHLNSFKFMSKEEHNRHAIAQGPWHIISSLSHILSLCAETHGPLLVEALRPRQIEWIRGQLLRVAAMLNCKPSNSLGGAVDSEDEVLMKCIVMELGVARSCSVVEEIANCS